uniref:FAD/NAD(P)-binding domain-containing protein n=1 Tax=Mycena chlorophos TaxID=658473 RepID=A0ABQ0M2X3_MYCCL|nr:FAD/NAD(P)-binding domain-containing protein [Mycena chlorophos]
MPVTVPLNFIIVGASIAGLAAAIALKKAGHDVLVLERAERLGEGSSVVRRRRRRLAGVYCSADTADRSPPAVLGAFLFPPPRPRPSSSSHAHPHPPTRTRSIPPNGSKILYDWGLHADIQALSYRADAPAFSAARYEGKGPNNERDLMGYQAYNEEMLSEARGNFLNLRYPDLVTLLSSALQRTSPSPSDAAVVRLGVEVTSIDLDECVVTLSTGERLGADAIIGADGPEGVVRHALKTEEDRERRMRRSGVFSESGVSEEEGEQEQRVEQDADWHTFWAYSGVVPAEDVAKLSQEELSVYTDHGNVAFWGDERAAVVLHIRDEISVCFMSPDANQPNISAALGPHCDAGLRQLAAWADTNTTHPPVIMESRAYDALDSWVSESGRVVVLGEAAHPFPLSSIQTYACALEDSAFLGKIFSHTDDSTRVPEFLYAFQEHREPRTSMILSIENKYHARQTLANGQVQAMRDGLFRLHHARGKNILDMSEHPTLDAAMMEETRAPTDDADEWWMKWGRFHDFTPSEHQDDSEDDEEDEEAYWARGVRPQPVSVSMPMPGGSDSSGSDDSHPSGGDGGATTRSPTFVKASSGWAKQQPAVQVQVQLGQELLVEEDETHWLRE